MNKFLVILLFGLMIGEVHAQSYYISPSGDDTQSGLSPTTPLQSLQRGLELVKPGDSLLLLPGTYPASNQLNNLHGSPNLPIVISSYSQNPLEFAIIDAQAKGSAENGNEAFVLENCSWLNIEHLIFRNCWASVILIRNSPYISIRSCHFSTGKRIVHAIGHGTHHVLVENCYVSHPEEVWKGWSWETLHHGALVHYNGALLHPNQSAGGHVMRGNTLLHVYNAFRTRPVDIREDGNTEVYNNLMVNIRDNEFEPETWAWNMHYYYNRHINIHKMYSIDGVKGGNIYIYGNTYTQTKDPWAIEEVSGIFKYSAYEEGPLTYPCYAFNNSYYTEAEVLRRGESTNHQLKHFNNAYHFFEGSQRFHLKEWQPGYELDYDCINQDWPPNIYAHQQEQHGLKHTDPMFANGLEGDFRLKKESLCIDAGKVMKLPEFDWVQRYEGNAPDIGAYEGNVLTDGPAFRFIPSPNGALYEEYPRISRHRISGNTLTVYFSAPIAPSSLATANFRLYQEGNPIKIDSISFPRNLYEIVITTSIPLKENKLSIVWDQGLTGQNGLEAISWGSTLPVGKTHSHPIDLSSIPVEKIPEFEVPDYTDVSLEIPTFSRGDSAVLKIMSNQPFAREFVDRAVIYSADGDDLAGLYPYQVSQHEALFKLGKMEYPKGQYSVRLRLGKQVFVKEFEVP